MQAEMINRLRYGNVLQKDDHMYTISYILYDRESFRRKEQLLFFNGILLRQKEQVGNLVMVNLVYPIAFA